MKVFPNLILSAILCQLVFSSCTKDGYGYSSNPKPARTIQFNLYTEKDFSNDNHNIIFSLFIKTHTKTLFDSTLSVMKIKDIPLLANKLTFEKKVPNDDGTDLAVGFHYTIENVGSAGYTDTCKAGNALKKVDFSFQ
ncbi:MAG: hypothetical protein ABUT20_44330 [Bacteroidota bacterium]